MVGQVVSAFLVILCVATPTTAAPPRPSETVRRGSEIVFHGWSHDSKYVAYTRLRFGPKATVLERQRMHRQVRGGDFTGFGKMVGGDVEGHARRSGYVATPLPWRRLSETALELVWGQRRLLLELDVGREHGWRLWHDRRLLASHRFDRIYVGFHAEMYPSPNGRQAIVVMHLESGWDVDAAAFPVDLSALADESARLAPPPEPPPAED